MLPVAARHLYYLPFLTLKKRFGEANNAIWLKQLMTEKYIIIVQLDIISIWGGVFFFLSTARVFVVPKRY